MTDTSKTSLTKACMTCGQEYADGPDVCPFDGTPLTTIAAELAPGTVLGDRYEIISAVASGGMGKLYKAQHKLMKRVVAIKTIHMSLISSGAALQRFQQEAQAVSALNHPNILTVFDFFVSNDGQPYFVMDYLQGTNLQEVLDTETTLPIARAVPIFMDACLGLAHAHEHGVIHRDIKPANIMLVEFGGRSEFVKIIDFGIAKVTTEGEGNHLTATGDVFGSPEYMSPEQCRAKTPDARSDVYSLGCVMYKTLTGTSPFASPEAMESMYKQVNVVPPTLSVAFPAGDFPPVLKGIVMKALHKEPDERFQTMAEMYEALSALAIGQTMHTAAFQLNATQAVQAAAANTQASQAVTGNTQAPGAAGTAVQAVTTSATPAAGLDDWKKWAVGGLMILILVIFAVQQKQLLQRPSSSTVPTTTSDPSAQSNVQPVQLPPSAPPLPAGTPAPTQPSVQVAAPAPAKSAPSAASSVQSTPSAPMTRRQQMDYYYNAYYQWGQKLYKQKDLQNAEGYFKAAHAMSENFGSKDVRYLDSLYWVAKCNIAEGEYEAAKQQLEYVLYAQKARFGDGSSQVKATEAALNDAKKALHRE